MKMDSPAAAIVIDAIQFLHDRRRGRRSNRNDDQNHKKEHQLGTAALASWTLHHLLRSILLAILQSTADYSRHQ